MKGHTRPSGWDHGVPTGTLDLLYDTATAAAEEVSHLAGSRPEVDRLGLALQLHLPGVMAASYGSAWFPCPPPPRPMPGGGFISADLGATGDAEAFARLLGTLGAAPTAREVAEAAQSWRLPVCEYRPRAVPTWPMPPSAGQPAPASSSGSAPAPRGESRPAPSAGRPPLRGLKVCELGGMWAGPLAAWLLGRLGAEVVKVEAPFRPDGTRALHGPGVRPGDRPRCPGADSGIFNALSTGKTSVVLDARSSSGRAELEGLLEGCDVVIEAFSPRVIPNLGLGACRDGQGRKAGSVWVSIPAFPSGPERDYVAYGNGIHAASGLGNDGRGGYQSPAVTYVDPVAGFGACRAALGALAGGSFLKPTAWIEVSLWSAVQPLLRRPPAPLVPPPASLGADLLQKAVIEGGAEVVRDGAGTHWYPRGPWRGGTWDLPLGPPPAWAPVEGRT